MNRMYNRPPMILTAKTPEDIIGAHNMEIFVEHYLLTTRESNDGVFPSKLIDKEIGGHDRQKIADIYTDLRKHGYYHGGFHKGKIIWRTVLQSQQNEEFEKGMDDLRGKSLDELREIARAGFHKIGKI